MKQLKIQLDFRSGAPIYMQIVQQVEQMIVSGYLAVEDQLPTVRQMAAELRVNFNTIARAYRILDEAGLISTQQGRGTYIIEKPDDKTEQFIKTQTLEALTRQYLHESVKYGFKAEEIIKSLEKELLHYPEGQIEINDND